MIVGMFPTTFTFQNKVLAFAAKLVLLVVVTLAHSAHTISNRERN